MGIQKRRLPEPISQPNQIDGSDDELQESFYRYHADNDINLDEIIKAEETAQEQYKLIKDKQYENIIEFLNVLVNGDPISQLFINSELTSKAKEELINLQDATVGKNITEKEEILASLKREITEASSKVDELKNEIIALEGTKNMLSREVETLKKRKRIVTESVINDLNIVKSSSSENNDDESNLQWRRQVVGWDSIWDDIRCLKIENFDSIINSYIKEYSQITGCSYDDALKQFYYVSPRIKDVSDYIKTHAEELKPFTKFYDWFSHQECYPPSEDGEFIRHIRYRIKVPSYSLAKAFEYVKVR